MISNLTADPCMFRILNLNIFPNLFYFILLLFWCIVSMCMLHGGLEGTFGVPNQVSKSLGPFQLNFNLANFNIDKALKQELGSSYSIEVEKSCG